MRFTPSSFIGERAHRISISSLVIGPDWNARKNQKYFLSNLALVIVILLYDNCNNICVE